MAIRHVQSSLDMKEFDYAAMIGKELLMEEATMKHVRLSPYRIEVPLDDYETILYSTLTTSLIVVTNDELRCLHAGQFDSCEGVGDLVDMGFLHNVEDPQDFILKEMRQKVIDADTGIVGVTVAPTMACNARCYYCFEHGARWGTMDERTADATADFLISNCLNKKLYIAWFGGEPLMAVDVIDRITDRLHEADIEVESTITTNGILLDEDIIARLESWGTYRVQISLDGIGEEYNKVKSFVGITGNPFERVMSNIEQLFAVPGLSVHLRVNYLSTDPDTIRTTFDYLNKRFGHHESLYLYGAPLDLPDRKSYSEFDCDEGETFLNVLHLSLDNGFENDELNFRAGVNVSGDYNAVLGELMLSPFPTACFMTNRWRFVIDDQGYLYKCQKHLGKSECACGNVFDGIDHNEYLRFYETAELHDPSCVECFMLPICQGGCNANRLLYGNRFACPPSKSIAPDLVMTYYRYLMGEEEALEETMSKYGRRSR